MLEKTLFPHKSGRCLRAGAGKVAGGGGGHRRGRRAGRFGLLCQRGLGHGAEAGAPVAAVAAASGGRGHRPALPPDQAGRAGHRHGDRCHTRGPRHKAAAGAGHLCVHCCHPPVRRQRRARGRGAADRRRSGAEYRAPLPARRQGPAPGDPVRHERAVFRPLRHAAHGHDLCTGGNQRRRGLLRRPRALSRFGAGGLRCDQPVQSGADALCRHGPGAHGGYALARGPARRGLRADERAPVRHHARQREAL